MRFLSCREAGGGERSMHAAESPEEVKLALLTPAGINAVKFKTCTNKDETKKKSLNDYYR